MASRRAALGLAALALIGVAATAIAQDLKPTALPERERFRWPLRGPVAQPFKAGTNDGIDIAAPVGEAVHAAADGVVISATELDTYGKLVVLRHANGYVTVYADMSEIDVKEGDQVRRGQIIAKSGKTGNVPAPRLHFELRRDGKAIDPIPLMVPI